MFIYILALIKGIMNINIQDIYQQVINEARNNQISPQNLYSTETIKNFIESQGDSYFELGDYIFTRPIDQPCDYSKYTSKTYCVSNPHKGDWGLIKSHGVRFYYIFKKMDEGINRKKLGAFDVMGMSVPSERMMGMILSMTVDQLTDYMWGRAMDEVGEDFKYDKDYVRGMAQDVKDEGYAIETYDRDNNVIRLNDFKQILTNAGIGFSDLKDRIS